MSAADDVQNLDPFHPWRSPAGRGAGPFVTWVEYRRPNGLVARWESRAHRKQHNRLNHGASTWWAPGAVAWWIGVLFMVGSACFAVGSVPGYESWVGVDADNVTYFVGSLFFTSAAFLQYLEVVNVDPVGLDDHPGRRVRFFGWEPGRIDWWATAVQLVGTLFFNISTFAALLAGFGATRADAHVWRPDALGSVCFLVASELAFAEIGHRWLSWRPRVLSWWIAALNLAGSVAFGVSAVAAYVVPGSGEPRNAELVNVGTFVGALGFLIGAFLLLPERTEPTGQTLAATT